MRTFLVIIWASLACCYGQNTGVTLVVLGTVQDGGSPHIGCQKECCAALFINPDQQRKVTSIGIIDASNMKQFLFEATPDFPEQLNLLTSLSDFPSDVPDGIFLTHAHVGHYAGLLYLGREAMNANKAKVYAMPRMTSFLTENGPWSQLVDLQNIALLPLTNGTRVELTSNISILPFTVPHRDEFSETVGFKIIGPNKTVLFIPDIDKWSKWTSSIIDEINNVDYAFIDATFYDGEELNNRNMAEIPHPFVKESMALFDGLDKVEISKIHFIHFNHTNPLLEKQSDQYQSVKNKGYNIAYFLQQLKL